MVDCCFASQPPLLREIKLGHDQKCIKLKDTLGRLHEENTYRHCMKIKGLKTLWSKWSIRCYSKPSDFFFFNRGLSTLFYTLQLPLTCLSCSLFTMAILYRTFGKELLKEPVNVTTDSTVVLPSATRAGTESWGIQNDSQERTTNIMVGMYIWRKAYPSRRLNEKWATSFEWVPGVQKM